MSTYTLREFAAIKNVSHDTILKRIKDKTLSSDCVVKKLSGKRGAYLIEVIKTETK